MRSISVTVFCYLLNGVCALDPQLTIKLLTSHQCPLQDDEPIIGPEYLHVKIALMRIICGRLCHNLGYPSRSLPSAGFKDPWEQNTGLSHSIHVYHYHWHEFHLSIAIVIIIIITTTTTMMMMMIMLLMIFLKHFIALTEKCHIAIKAVV